jgi:hypothetical protein
MVDQVAIPRGLMVIACPRQFVRRGVNCQDIDLMEVTASARGRFGLDFWL